MQLLCVTDPVLIKKILCVGVHVILGDALHLTQKANVSLKTFLLEESSMASEGHWHQRVQNIT